MHKLGKKYQLCATYTQNSHSQNGPLIKFSQKNDRRNSQNRPNVRMNDLQSPEIDLRPFRKQLTNKNDLFIATI